MNHIDIAAKQLAIDEGIRDKPYRDSVGKLSIGIGRNLDDVGLRPDEIEYLFRNDLFTAEADARSLVPGFDDLTDARKAVLVNMSFNMGKPVLSQFRNTLKAISDGRYGDAADGMLASKWAKQVGQRAVRLAKIMREG
jgi:lysozyme